MLTHPHPPCSLEWLGRCRRSKVKNTDHAQFALSGLLVRPCRHRCHTSNPSPGPRFEAASDSVAAIPLHRTDRSAAGTWLYLWPPQSLTICPSHHHHHHYHYHYHYHPTFSLAVRNTRLPGLVCAKTDASGSCKPERRPICAIGSTGLSRQSRGPDVLFET